MKKYKIIPIFVPHSGCPHCCSFCNQRHITGQHSETTPAAAQSVIEKYLSTIDSEKNHVEVAFYGGSFTAIDINKQNALLDVALQYKKQGKIHGIRLSTRPDCITVEILENLKARGVTEIELGVQSMRDVILKKNNRGHTAEHVINSVALIKKYDFEIGLQMMVGLIGDSKEDVIYTTHEITRLKPDFVRIYPTLVFKNTKLHELYLKGEYTPLTVEQAVEICASALKIFNDNNIKVIRLGLLLDGEDAKNNYVAGPYYPRFSEVVRSRVFNVS
ncbi:MAG: radical SAM protein [Clostridiaceae bacterium]|nr:radical SAM protein [Clostridiaceae bacterium]